MPRLVTGERLRQAVVDGSFIKAGDPDSVEGLKYDFHLGGRVLKAKYQQPKDIDSIPEEFRVVSPGEAVFVLSKERLDLPDSMIAVLTPKRKLAHDGIMIMGGLAVDPLYRGFLLIGLYNISSTPFPLLPGRKLIGAVFYELSAEEVVPGMAAPPEIKDFPDDLVKLIRDYEPVGLKALQDQIEETQRELQTLKSDIVTDRDWKREFKDSLDEHNKQLGALIDGLKEEREIRRAEDEKIREKLDSKSEVFFGLRLGWRAFVALIAILLAAAAGHYVPKWLSRSPVQAPASASPLAAGSVHPPLQGAAAAGPQ